MSKGRFAASAEISHLLQWLQCLQRFLAQPFYVATQFTGNEGVYVKVSDTVKDVKDILAGKYDDKPESWFYMAPGPLSEKKD